MIGSRTQRKVVQYRHQWRCQQAKERGRPEKPRLRLKRAKIYFPQRRGLKECRTEYERPDAGNDPSLMRDGHRAIPRYLGPVAMGRSPRPSHSVHEPSNSAFGSLPSVSRASHAVAAATPEPQVVITGWSRSTPPATKARRNWSAGSSLPSFTNSADGT